MVHCLKYLCCMSCFPCCITSRRTKPSIQSTHKHIPVHTYIHTFQTMTTTFCFHQLPVSDHNSPMFTFFTRQMHSRPAKFFTKLYATQTQSSLVFWPVSKNVRETPIRWRVHLSDDQWQATFHPRLTDAYLNDHDFRPCLKLWKQTTIMDVEGENCTFLRVHDVVSKNEQRANESPSLCSVMSSSFLVSSWAIVVRHVRYFSYHVLLFLTPPNAAFRFRFFSDVETIMPICLLLNKSFFEIY